MGGKSSVGGDKEQVVAEVIKVLTEQGRQGLVDELGWVVEGFKGRILGLVRENSGLKELIKDLRAGLAG